MYIYNTDLSTQVRPISLKVQCKTQSPHLQLHSNCPYPNAPNTPLCLSTDYSPYPPSQIPTNKDETIIQQCKETYDLFTQSGQRRLNWNGRKGLDPLINQKPGWPGQAWSLTHSLCIILGLYPLPDKKFPPQYVFEIFKVCSVQRPLAAEPLEILFKMQIPESYHNQ